MTKLFREAKANNLEENQSAAIIMKKMKMKPANENTMSIEENVIMKAEICVYITSDQWKYENEEMKKWLKLCS